ncbi:MAG: pro-sigmaK processing inhibitor BofA family protein [Clostridia bacterium]|nr:pro-sigmaK processing inhibitor BofA family protein [Clostridia bacterium]HAQ63490.1 hypothetical protein [Oscillospiraceae bacterium]
MTAVYVVLGIAGLFILISMVRSGRFFSALIITALQGITALFSADFIGSFIGVNLSVNAFTITLSALGGIPAVILLLISGVLFR